MIHKFKMHGINIVLDVYSGAVHVVDDLVFDLLDYPRCPKNADEETRQAFAEIEQLKAEGTLFSEDSYTDEVMRALPRENAPIKALCLHVSHDCNLRCRYCFADEGKYTMSRSMMDEKTGRAAIDFVIAKSQGRRNIEIDFFGGEPLMNFEVVKGIVRYAKQEGARCGKNFRFTITSNGLLLSDDKLDFINENMGNLVLSLDGRPEVNDGNRKTVSGEGSYGAVLSKLQNAAKSREGKDHFIRGTFTRENLDFTKDVLHLRECGFRQISVEPVVGDADKPYSIREEDLPIIFEEYERLAKVYRSADFNFFHFNIDLSGGPCAVKRLAGCGAGIEYLAVTPEGDIYPCHQFVGLEGFCMGNVNTGKFDRQTRCNFSEATVGAKEECRACWAKFFCSGGCHANAYQQNGDILKPYKIGCELQRKRVECALYLAAAKEYEASP